MTPLCLLLSPVNVAPILLVTLGALGVFVYSIIRTLPETRRRVPSRHGRFPRWATWFMNSRAGREWLTRQCLNIP